MLSARVPDALHDEIAAVLGNGSLGVEIAASGPGMSELRIYLEQSDDAERFRERASRVFAAHGLPAEAVRLSLAPVADGRWVETWQATLAPIPLGSRFVVLPGGPADDASGRDPIVLIPGRAFGTGEHETTRLCAAALEGRVVEGTRWLDLGTGTGVLAIVVARCGAARVLALDLDPEAAEVASEVVAQNGDGSKIEVRAGSIDGAFGERFDGVVANIQSSFFISHAKELASALVPRGTLVASGFLREDVDDVSSALAAAGVSVETRESDGPWVCLAARRGAV